jgi:hypothetical protein
VAGSQIVPLQNWPESFPGHVGRAEGIDSGDERSNLSFSFKNVDLPSSGWRVKC